MLPGQLPPRIIAPKQWPPEKLPPDNYLRVVNLHVVAPQTIPPSWLPKIILSSKIFYKFFTNNVFSSWARIFLSCIDNFIWQSTSSSLIFQQNSYISTKRQKNIFPYLQLTNFVIWTHGNYQLRRIITLENIMIWKYLWKVIG